MGDWLEMDKIELRNAEYLAVAQNPAAVALVEARIKPSLKRVADIPVICSGHETGFYVSLKVEDDTVRVMYLRQESMPSHMRPDGITLGNAVAAPLDARCQTCNKRTNRSAPWVLGEALKALTTRRPVIRI